MNQVNAPDPAAPVLESPPPVPWFSLSKYCPVRTDTTRLAAYYANRGLMLGNLAFICIATVGWYKATEIITPLKQTTLKEVGVHEDIQGLMNGVNNWAVAFLVMLFSWMSDHTVSRFGRRRPYLYIAAPFIIAATLAFPFFAEPEHMWLLLVLQGVYLLFMDLKGSTFELVIIDCVPRDMLARARAIQNIVGAATGFVASWYTKHMLEVGLWLPFVVGAFIMTATTLVALLFHEPPIYHPRTEAFKPWTTFQVTLRQDKRLFLLMASIACIACYLLVFNSWVILWATVKLGMSKGDAIQALAWRNLAALAVAYPIAWLIDRYCSLKLVVLYWVLSAACFVATYWVYGKMGLAWLTLAQAAFGPLEQTVHIMLIRASPPQYVGSITATKSCFRNLMLGTMVILTGYAITWTGTNYYVAFAIGMAVSTLGLLFALGYAWAMRGTAGELISAAELAAQAEGAAALRAQR